MSALNAFRQRYLVRFWSPLPALVALGVASAYYFALTGTFWAVTGEFTRWGGHVLSWFGYQPQDWSYFRLIGLQGTPLDRIDGVMIIGMFLGALCCALWAGNVSLRWPTSKRRLLQGLVGGIVAGFGARLAMGCNLAAFFTGIPMFSLHAWAFMFATVGGAWIGVKISLLPFLRTPLKVGATASALPDAESLARRTRLQARLGLAVLALAALFAAWRFEVSLVLGMACLFGLLFGGLIERAQICFTSAARDLWTTGRTRAAFGILLGMARPASVPSPRSAWASRRRSSGWARMRSSAAFSSASASSSPAVARPAGCTVRWKARCTSGWSASATSSAEPWWRSFGTSWVPA